VLTSKSRELSGIFLIDEELLRARA